jgi:hypothetical protein
MHRISTGIFIFLLALVAGGAGLAATATPTRAQEAPTATPTIFVVTPTARPEDLFAAATAITRLTVEATTTGTATPLPANWRVATATPTPRIVTSTPTAENPATATAMVARETAQALVNGPARPFVTATPTLAPVIVTPTPRVDELFALATLAVRLTTEAATTGTPTPLPAHWLVATPTMTPRVVTATPTPENEATAVLNVARETALALVRGTPLPFVTATPAPTNAPAAARAAATWTPTRTATPIFVELAELTATPAAVTAPFPAALQGKILFLGNRLGGRQPEAYAINPDGTGLVQLTSLEFYRRAKERDAASADRRYRAEAQRDRTTQRIQVVYHDAVFGSTNPLTQFGAGTAWAPAWSPAGDVVALVSSESRNDEIWLVRLGEWPGQQLTQNDWEWDHSPSWAPDGSELVFSSNRGGGRRQLWLMRADGGDQRPLVDLPFEAWDPVWVKYLDQ